MGKLSAIKNNRLAKLLAFFIVLSIVFMTWNVYAFARLTEGMDVTNAASSAQIDTASGVDEPQVEVISQGE